MALNPELAIQANIDFLANTPTANLTAWMLESMSLTPIGFRDDRTASELLINTIYQAAPEIQTKVKTAITAAIKSWDLPVHGLEILSDLAFVTGMTRNIDALGPLIEIVDGKSIEGETEDLIDTRSSVVSVVQGFAPDLQAKEALERWWADQKFDWRHTQQLFLGLISCSPDNAESYLQEFFQRIAEHKDYFFDFLGYITSEAAGFVGADSLQEILERHDNEIAQQMLAFMPVAREILTKTYG